MNILICDDVPEDSTKLAKLIESSGYNVNTVMFHKGADALEHIISGEDIDICFLDIVMPDMNGIALAEKLREAGYMGKIVFLTHSNSYASESYNVDAFYYLLKPPTADSVHMVMRKLENARKNSDTNGILIKTVGMSRYVLFRDISHVEVMQHKVYFGLVNCDVLEVSATFGALVSKLVSDNRFVQCHRSFVVNMTDISSIEGNDIVMRSGKKVPISKRYNSVKKQYMQWVFGKQM